MACFYQRDPTVTWAHVEAHPRQFDSFEDPVTNSYVDTQQFRDAYGEALDTLDGSDLMSYVDYYFTETPMIQGTWVFKDDDVRQEFYELCVESGCMLSLKEIQEGETKTDKAARKAKEASFVTFSAPDLTSAWSDEWSEDEEEEEEEEREEKTAVKGKEEEEERRRQREAKKKEEEQKQKQKQLEKEKVSHIMEKPCKEDGGKKHHQHKSKKDEKKDEKKDGKKKKDKETLVPPPLVPGLEHPSKRTLVTAHMQKYGKGDQGRRAVQHAHSRDAVMREFVELIQVLDRLDLSASDRATVNTRLDTIVTLLEHSA